LRRRIQRRAWQGQTAEGTDGDEDADRGVLETGWIGVHDESSE
jgi:hypothetical protein